MARMNSKVAHGYDGELVLDDGGVAHTNGGDNPSKVDNTASFIDLLALTEAYWDNDEVAFAEEFAIQLIISAADDADGDETYVFHVETDRDSDFGDDLTKVLTYTHPRGETGVRELLVSRDHLEEAEYESRFMRLNVVAGGNTPSITYKAFVAPVRN